MLQNSLDGGAQNPWRLYFNGASIILLYNAHTQKLQMKRILFVCHGNICRSVMAEMVLRHMAEKAGIVDLIVDSCATSTEEIGNDIYPPAKRCLERHGVPYSHHAARQITLRDFEKYDQIYCMDANNMRNLRRMFGEEHVGQVVLLMSLVGESRDVADPWYTGDFEATYRDVVAGCEEILKKS